MNQINEPKKQCPICGKPMEWEDYQAGMKRDNEAICVFCGDADLEDLEQD